MTRGRSARGNPGDRQQWPPPACRYPELPRLRRHRLSAAWRTGRFRVGVMTDQDGLPAAQDRCAGGHRLTHLGPAMSGPVRFARGGPAPGLHRHRQGPVGLGASEAWITGPRDFFAQRGQALQWTTGARRAAGSARLLGFPDPIALWSRYVVAGNRQCPALPARQSPSPPRRNGLRS